MLTPTVWTETETETAEAAPADTATPAASLLLATGGDPLPVERLCELLAVWCGLRTVPCMRRFRDICLVVSVTVVFVLFAACSGDDPPASTGEPVVDTAAPATVPPTTSVAPTTSRATATVTVPVTVPVTVTLPTSGDVAELIDESVAFSAGPIVRAWVDSAWSAPASDPFGYDYSLWVDELAAPSANVAGLRAGPLTVSLTELAELDLGDPFLEKMSADLRSMLWLEAALAGGDDWRVFRNRPWLRGVGRVRGNG